MVLADFFIISMDDGFILVLRPGEEQATKSIQGHLADIDQIIRGLEPVLWPLNTSIHDNPELGFKEYKTHDALTNFMQSQEGWRVTRSAYGMETAWKAEYDSGRPGPVVSFNAEMGMPEPEGDEYYLQTLTE
jgi:hypothetical protein